MEKEIKSIVEDQRRKQVEFLKVLKPEESQQDLKSVERLFPNDVRTNEITRCKKKIKRTNLNYETNQRTDFDFQQFKTIKSFSESIVSGKVTISEADIDQSNLLENIMEFSNKSRPRREENKIKKEILLIV